MHSITVVVPIYKPCSFRTRNLTFLLNELNNLNLNIIVAEQTSDNVGATGWIENLPNISYINIKTNCTYFHKSYILNKITEYIETEYIWFIDCDFYTDFRSILENQQYKYFDFYKPFGKCKDLNEVQTQQLVETKHIQENMLRDNMSSDRSIKYFGALSYICKLDKFIKSGRLDIGYVGWGYEDLDLFLNIYNQKYSIGVASDVNAVHMWHLPVAGRDRCMLTNKRYFETKGYTINQVKQAHNELFESKTTIDY